MLWEPQRHPRVPATTAAKCHGALVDTICCCCCCGEHVGCCCCRYFCSHHIMPRGPQISTSLALLSPIPTSCCMLHGTLATAHEPHLQECPAAILMMTTCKEMAAISRQLLLRQVLGQARQVYIVDRDQPLAAVPGTSPTSNTALRSLQNTSCCC